MHHGETCCYWTLVCIFSAYTNLVIVSRLLATFKPAASRGHTTNCAYEMPNALLESLPLQIVMAEPVHSPEAMKFRASGIAI